MHNYVHQQLPDLWDPILTIMQSVSSYATDGAKLQLSATDSAGGRAERYISNGDAAIILQRYQSNVDETHLVAACQSVGHN